MGPDNVDYSPSDTSPFSASLADHVGVEQHSTLLSLPIEIFQIITRYMDQSTFFISLLTCRQFMIAALCRDNLSRHLHSLPGLRLGLDTLSTADLLRTLRKRVSESGFAAGVLADVTRHAPRPGETVTKGAFSPARLSHANSPDKVATAGENGRIFIYDLAAAHVHFKTELQINTNWEDMGRMDIIKMAFSRKGRDLAVLYRETASAKKVSPFVDDFLGNDDVYKLVTFHCMYSPQLGYCHYSHEQETREIKYIGEEEPVGLAIASNGIACIAWRHPSNRSKTKVWLIGREGKLMDACKYDRDPHILEIEDPPNMPAHRCKERFIFNVDFVEDDDKLNLYKPDGEYYFEEFAVGMPFSWHHTPATSVDWQPEPVCNNSYLALGMIEDPNKSNHPDVFVVQATSYITSTSCDHHEHLDEGRNNTSWIALALLAGWRQGTSSLGTVMAISPGGTRIAAAMWSRVFIWSLNPFLLHQGELQHYFPKRDFNMRKGIGRLRPTLLSSEGVVHSMLWTNEERLYASTDRGLIKWHMGNMSSGERENLSLEYDTWPESAVAAPITGSYGLQLRWS